MWMVHLTSGRFSWGWRGCLTYLWWSHGVTVTTNIDNALKLLIPHLEMLKNWPLHLVCATQNENDWKTPNKIAQHFWYNWNPTHKYLVDKFENVQRQFTKRITLISHLTYHERLSILDLESLESFDLIQYYKILNSLTPLNYTKYFTYHQPSSYSRKPSTFLIKPINNHHSSTDQWTAAIHFLKHSKKLILLAHLGKTCLWLTCLPF